MWKLLLLLNGHSREVDKSFEKRWLGKRQSSFGRSIPMPLAEQREMNELVKEMIDPFKDHLTDRSRSRVLILRLNSWKWFRNKVNIHRSTKVFNLYWIRKLKKYILSLWIKNVELMASGSRDLAKPVNSWTLWIK